MGVEASRLLQVQAHKDFDFDGYKYRTSCRRIVVRALRMARFTRPVE